MNDSCLSDLNIQGQQMNLGNVNTPNRPQWGAAPRGTIISVLEQATAYDHTMSSTTNNETSDISLKALAKRVDPALKHETYVISSPKPVASLKPKPIETDLIVEDFNKTLTPQPKQNKNQK
jgi:hypothetical protein